MNDIPKDVHLQIFRTMTTIHRCDERFRALIGSGRITVNLFSVRGQEAIAAGIAPALEPDDYMVTTYRGLADALAKGVSLRNVWAEYLGKETGPCRGRGGPMHLTDPAAGLMVTTGIVGSGLPIANGLALASLLRGESRVAVVNFGDGASNIGAFHEALNLAAVWSLPVVFVCTNNRYAEHTAFETSCRVGGVVERAAAYGLPGQAVDGTDPAAVFEVASAALARARRGEGPTLIEASAFRFFGHYFGDTQTYLRPGELEAAKGADPVPTYRARLLADGVASEADLAAIEAEVDAALDDAVEYAIGSADPDAAGVEDHVYAGAAQ